MLLHMNLKSQRMQNGQTELKISHGIQLSPFHEICPLQCLKSLNQCNTLPVVAFCQRECRVKMSREITKHNIMHHEM